MDPTELLTPLQLERAALHLRQGRLVAFPTETVYGLGACIFNPNAVLSIFKAKGRPSDNPLIAHVSSVEQVADIAESIPDEFYLLAKHFFPGPLAIILKRKLQVPAIVSAGLDTIAVRMPSHPVALKLIAHVQEPLVAPSANLSGKPSATMAKHVMEDFEGKISAIVDGGPTQYGIESTVISLVSGTPVLLRPGAVCKEQIEKVLGGPVETAASMNHGPVLSPGMKYRHYCPCTPVKVFYALSDLHKYLRIIPAEQKTMILSRHPVAPLAFGMDWFSLLAKEFYAQLRFADEENYREILIYCDEAVQKEDALMNRLTRAAAS